MWVGRVVLNAPLVAKMNSLRRPVECIHPKFAIFAEIFHCEFIIFLWSLLQSGRAQPHSKTWRNFGRFRNSRSVLERGCALPLWIKTKTELYSTRSKW